MTGTIQYERQLKSTYLIIHTVNEAVLNSFAGQIAIKGYIKELVKCAIVCADGCSNIEYDITGGHDLTSVYAAKKIQYADLENIMEQLIQVVNDMEKYLMDGLQLVLSPEFVYFELETKRIQFIFDFSECKTKSDIIRLGEFLIEKVDHEDEKATELAYLFYELCREGNFPIERIEEYIEKQKKEKYRKKEALRKESEDISDKRASNTECSQYTSKLEGKTTFIDKIKMLFRREKKKDPLSYFDRALPEDRNYSDELEKVKEQFMDEWGEEKGTVFEEDQDEGQTVYVGKNCFERSYSIIELRKNREITHKVEKFPYIIGTQKDNVSLYVKDSGISRLHVRLTKEENSIFLEDLHSTNGTLINDMPVIPHEKVKIRRGDLIMMGKTEFEFR